jgi:nicotinamide phosphoribosyltransferase
MWERILTHHNGMIPLRICAVKEGSSIPINNVTMTVEATDNTINPITKKGYFLPLVNHFETILTHQWGTQNVATISKFIYMAMKKYFQETVDDDMHWLIPFMLHDFGYRGVMCDEQAAVAGLGHLSVFQGTDTVAAVIEAIRYYSARDIPGVSVLASEHSVMTQKLEVGELSVLNWIIQNTPDGVILSLVADSYDIVRFILKYLPTFKELIERKNLKVVVRPDSPRFKGDTVEDQVVWISKELEKLFGSTVNKKGYKTINPNFGVIYGDGIGPDDILKTLELLKDNGFAVSICVFGMGGGLLQKHNRDTQRKAFKCCARESEGGWEDVYKNPLDKTKASKRGLLALIKENGVYNTIRENELNGRINLLEPVFENGVLLREQNWSDVVSLARSD